MDIGLSKNDGHVDLKLSMDLIEGDVLSANCKIKNHLLGSAYEKMQFGENVFLRKYPIEPDILNGDSKPANPPNPQQPPKPQPDSIKGGRKKGTKKRKNHKKGIKKTRKRNRCT